MRIKLSNKAIFSEKWSEQENGLKFEQKWNKDYETKTVEVAHSPIEYDKSQQSVLLYFIFAMKQTEEKMKNFFAAKILLFVQKIFF